MKHHLTKHIGILILLTAYIHTEILNFGMTKSAERKYVETYEDKQLKIRLNFRTLMTYKEIMKTNWNTLFTSLRDLIDGTNYKPQLPGDSQYQDMRNKELFDKCSNPLIIKTQQKITSCMRRSIQLRGIWWTEELNGAKPTFDSLITSIEILETEINLANSNENRLINLPVEDSTHTVNSKAIEKLTNLKNEIEDQLINMIPNFTLDTDTEDSTNSLLSFRFRGYKMFQVPKDIQTKIITTLSIIKEITKNELLILRMARIGYKGWPIEIEEINWSRLLGTQSIDELVWIRLNKENNQPEVDSPQLQFIKPTNNMEHVTIRLRYTTESELSTVFNVKFIPFIFDRGVGLQIKLGNNDESIIKILGTNRNTLFISDNDQFRRMTTPEETCLKAIQRNEVSTVFAQCKFKSISSQEIQIAKLSTDILIAAPLDFTIKLVDKTNMNQFTRQQTYPSGLIKLSDTTRCTTMTVGTQIQLECPRDTNFRTHIFSLSQSSMIQIPEYVRVNNCRRDTNNYNTTMTATKLAKFMLEILTHCMTKLSGMDLETSQDENEILASLQFWIFLATGCVALILSSVMSITLYHCITRRISSLKLTTIQNENYDLEELHSDSPIRIQEFDKC